MGLLRRSDIDGVFYVIAAAALLRSAFTPGKSPTSAASPHLARIFSILPPQPTPLAHDPAGAAKG
jgi:hypothetical protein